MMTTTTTSLVTPTVDVLPVKESMEIQQQQEDGDDDQSLDQLLDELLSNDLHTDGLEQITPAEDDIICLVHDQEDEKVEVVKESVNKKQKDIKETNKNKTDQTTLQECPVSCRDDSEEEEEDMDLLLLRSGTYTYKGFEADRQVCWNAHQQGQSMKQNMVVLDMKQRVADQDFSHPILALALQQEESSETTSFSYKGWQEDLKHLNRILLDIHYQSTTGNREQEMVELVQEMRDKQQEYIQNSTKQHKSNENEEVHGIPNDFSYPNWEQDRTKVLEWIQEGQTVQEEVEDMKFRQRVHQGEETENHLLKTLENAAFTYKGWQEDWQEIQHTLYTSPTTLGSIEVNVQRLLKGAKHQERMHKGEDVVPIVLDSDLFDYPGFDQDKEEALRSYRQGYDIVQEIQSMVDKQKDFGEQEKLAKDETNNGIGKATIATRQQCIICLEGTKSHAFAPCGHLCLCDACAKSPQYDHAATDSSNGRRKIIKCPICRRPSNMTIKIYSS